MNSKTIRICGVTLFIFIVVAVLIASFPTIDANAQSSEGVLYGLSSFPDKSVRLVIIDPDTGDVTSVGPGVQGDPSIGYGRKALDSAGHRYFFIGSFFDSDTGEVISGPHLFILDTQTGEMIGNPILENSVLDLQYDSETDTLFGISQIEEKTVKLAVINPDTGHVSHIGSGTSSVPGANLAVPVGTKTFDSIGNRYFFVAFYYDPDSWSMISGFRLFVLDTQTGEMIGNAILDNAILDLQYDPETDTLYGLSQIEEKTVKLAVINPDTGHVTPFGSGTTSIPGANLSVPLGTKALDVFGNRYFFVAFYYDPDTWSMISGFRLFVMDTQTGEMIDNPILDHSYGLRYAPATPVNQLPVLEIFTDVDVYEGGTKILTATAIDPDGDPLLYAWDTDMDGNFESPGESIVFSSETLDGPAIYEWAYQVCDDKGACDMDSVTINVLNACPVVDAGKDQTAIVNSHIVFEAAFSDAGVHDTHTSFWNYGNGETGTLSEYTYAVPGIYTVTFIVEDDDGCIGEDSFIVYVLSQQDATQDIIGEITDMVDAGNLSIGQGNALISKLEAAKSALDKGNAKASINMFNALINLVDAFVNTGKLSDTTGQLLLEAINEILGTLQ
ncbi:MAG: PKD domain-containing protein [Anaerolineae bacterium]|nr:PKD domain-containing protein [Anaerolineae bacterium]